MRMLYIVVALVVFVSTPFISGDANSPQLASSVNDLIRQQQAMQRTQLFKDETGTRRVLLGKRGDEYGLFVSQPGIDVFDASNDDLAFNSGQNVFKIVNSEVVASGATSVTAGGAGVWNNNSDTLTIPHGLSYVPAVQAYIETSGGNYKPLPFTGYANPAGGQVVLTFATAYTDATNLYIQLSILALNTSVDFGPLNIRYYLLQETAN